MALTDKLSLIGGAIRSKNGSSALIPLSDMPSAIAALPEYVEVRNSALILIDWDGTLLKAYTLSQVQSMAALPQLPARETELLTFQGWNWTLSDIKAHLTAHPDDMLYVGAIYTTTDGQDHDDGTAIKRVSTSIVKNQFSSLVYLRHISLPSGTTGLGFQTAFYNCYSLESLNVPSGVTSINDGTFRGCTSLRMVSLPGSITSIGPNAFRGCTGLTGIVIPEAVTAVNDYAFYNCYSLRHIHIPAGVHTIAPSCFQGTGIENMVLPGSVTEILSNAFNNCGRLAVLDLSAMDAVPTLANTNALANTPSDMIIYVKNAELLSAFSAATNWSAYASYLRIKEAVE